MTDSDALNTGSLSWAAARGLTMMTEWAGSRTLAPIIDATELPASLRGAVDTLLDHSRHFRLSKKRKPSVSVSAPYLQSVLDEFGSVGSAVARIHEVAAGLNLRVRVGIASDIVYDVGEPVLPLVWWNPARVELEELELHAFITEYNTGLSDR